MLKKFITIIFVLISLPALPSGRMPVKEERITILGSFTVCSNSHFLHRECYPDLGKICPVCMDTVLVGVNSAIFERRSKEECAICLERLVKMALK